MALRRRTERLGRRNPSRISFLCARDLIDRFEHGGQVALQDLVDAVDGLLRLESSQESVAFACCD
jgi:hypothetical protein